MKTIKTYTVLALVALSLGLGACSGEGGQGNNNGGEESAGLSVDSSQARACDVLLENADGVQISGVDFGDGVQGTFIREGDRTALSFHSSADAAIPDGSIQVRATGGSVDALTVARVECADRRGGALSQVGVTLKP